MKEISIGIQIAWKIAALEAAEMKSDKIEVLHFILGLFSFDKIPENQTNDPDYFSFISEKNLFYQLLRAHQIDINLTRRQIRDIIPEGKVFQPNQIIHRSDECKNLFIAASQYPGNMITPSIFFVAAISVHNSLIRKILIQNNINTELLIKELQPVVIEETKEKETREKSTYKNLLIYGTNMVKMAAESAYAEFEGRKFELRQLITSLGKKTKHNPLLIGEPGVGKTAIVEELARQIHQGKILPGRVIFQISAASLVAGTKFRGEFEERVIQIVEEAAKSPEVILFFDEIHQFIGAGSSEGGLDAANILKPALSKGTITCIGSTTISEYRKHIEKDSAFARRFNTISVNEPSAFETIGILSKIKPGFEEFHRVTIQDDAIHASVEYSVRYETDRCLPDKAIDLLDESCSAVANSAITSIETAGFVSEGSTAPLVTAMHVAKIISRKKDIPVSQITQVEAGKFSRMEMILKEKIKGQNEIIQEVANYIKISKAGMADPSKPVAVFLFIGPTGVGKTLLAKTLAATLFTSESDLIRYDMSEYMEQHTVSKLIGSPPGYVLSEEEGILIKNLRNKPYSVILFDEIDKAHPRILDILLQLFDEGRITDNKGRLIDGRNAIFIMTANPGQEERKLIGFNINEDQLRVKPLRPDLSKMFRQEFLNRINKVLVFQSLSKRDIETIVNQHLSDFFKLLKEKFNVTVQVTGDLPGFIVNRCSFETFGARTVIREIEINLKEPVSQHIIDSQAQGNSISGSGLKINVTADKLDISYASSLPDH